LLKDGFFIDEKTNSKVSVGIMDSMHSASFAVLLVLIKEGYQLANG
jgi:hypothetical protein